MAIFALTEYAREMVDIQAVRKPMTFGS
jgi:hypothetical protein